MIINFVVNPIAINGGWSPWDRRIGGSEEAVKEWSWRLAARGHKVSVYHNGQHGEYKGVEYLERTDYLARQPGVTVNVNYPDLQPVEPTLYWTTLDTQGGRDLSAFKIVAGISEYALRNTGLPDESVLLPPGYDDKQIYPGRKLPRTVLYASSPDRGLSTLLHAWPEVVRAVPTAQLLLTYGAQPDKALPNVIPLGEVDEDEMNDIYRTTDIWCHPANGGELYCMTGIKAQAAGCIPVYFPTMALAETVKNGFPTDKDRLASSLIEALNAPESEKEVLRGEMAKWTFPTWDYTSYSLLRLLKSL